MSVPRQIPTNPQRRERLVNLADFRRATGTEPSPSSADAEAHRSSEATLTEENTPGTGAD